MCRLTPGASPSQVTKALAPVSTSACTGATKPSASERPRTVDARIRSLHLRPHWWTGFSSTAAVKKFRERKNKFPDLKPGAQSSAALSGRDVAGGDLVFVGGKG